MTNLFNFLLSLDTWQLTSLTATIILPIIFTIHQSNTVHYPKNLPRVRENGGTRFSLKTRLAYYVDCKNMFEEAYNTYSKKGKTCLIPGLGFRDEIILPTKSLKWMAAQPDSVLSVYGAFIEMDQAKYSAGHEDYITDPWQGNLVRRDLNSVLETICDAMNNELGVAFDQRMGRDKEWKEITVWSTMRMIVAQASSRFTVGLPLCRNEEYLKASVDFTHLFIIIAGLIGAMPKFLRPFVGQLVHIPQYFNLRAIRKQFAPLYAERLQFAQSYEKDSPDEPQDHLQMMIRYGLAERPNEVTSLKGMTGRLALNNLGSFHQTSLTVTNLIFNVIASDKEFNTIAILREEIRSIVGDNQVPWTKAMVSKLVKCDSVCKETLRTTPFGSRGPIRKVMVDNLVTEDGITLPKGALVSILLTSQLDEDVFEDPSKFSPFRYAELREKGDTGASLVSLGERFLPFGYGRHACPGRFLLEFELKMILAYLLLNYDIELAEQHRGVRPESKWVAEAIMPPLEGKIRVRRRS